MYPLLKITDIHSKRKGYEYFSKLDILMQYYTFELDDESKDLCVISTPFGQYHYNCLAMGLKVSPDITQEIMEDLLCNIKESNVYIDDVGAFDDSWESHL